MYIFIVNPVAGNGRGLRTFRKLEKTKTFRQLPTNYYITTYPGHAEKLAQMIARQNLVDLQSLIVIGGDGTIHEVLNGLGEATIPIGFIPGGSGNDFGRGCGIKGSPESILTKIVKDTNGIAYWTGTMETDEKTNRHFVNSIGFGFDAQIADKANKSFYKKALNTLHLGTLTYVMALLMVLFRFKPFPVELVIDGEKKTIPNCWMVTIANHQFYGGGMRIIPTAKLQPNIVPVLVIQGISKWKILGLFLTVFTGKHISFREVSIYEAQEVILTSKNAVYYQIDGQTNICRTCKLHKNKVTHHVLGTSFAK